MAILLGRTIDSAGWIMVFTLALLVVGRHVLRFVDRLALQRTGSVHAEPDMSGASPKSHRAGGRLNVGPVHERVGAMTSSSFDSRSSTVSLMAAAGMASMDRRTVPTEKAKRASRTLVRVVMVATTVLALLDLYLLMP